MEKTDKKMPIYRNYFILSKEEFLRCQKSEEQIPIYLIKKLINTEDGFKYLREMFESPRSMFKIGYEENNQIAEVLKYNKYDLINVIQKSIIDGILTYSDKLIEKIAILKKSINVDIEINDKTETFNAMEFYNFINLPKEILEKFFKVEDDIDYEEKGRFLYALLKWLNTSPFKLKSSHREIISYIENQTIIEYDIYGFKTQNDDILQKININSKLHQKVYEYVNDNDSLVEKAITIYVILCSLFTYDLDIFITNNQGEVAKKHENIDNISFIKPYDSIVCYEFTYIYAKFLDELGIKCNINSFSPQKYGGGHANLDFKVGKYLLTADPLESIIKGDFFNARFNKPLHGLCSINLLAKSNLEIERLIERKRIELLTTTSEFSSTLKEYETLSLYEKNNIPIKDRVNILLQQLNNPHGDEIIFISYIMNLYENLFLPDERRHYIKITRLRNNNPNKKNKSLSLVISFLNKKEDGYEYDYYFYEDGYIRSINKTTLQESLYTGVLEYICKTDAKVPGFTEQLNNKIFSI